MRRKELMKLAPKEPSDKLISSAAGDRYEERKVQRKYYFWRDGRYKLQEVTIKTYATRFYFTAKEGNGILIIAVYNRHQLADGQTKPEMILYIDPIKHEWINRIGEKWSKSMFINSVARPANTDWSYAEDIFDDEDLRLVEETLKTAEDSIEQSIAAWQASAREKENVKKAEKRAEYWNRQMAKIPELPEDFGSWVSHEGTLHSNFIFYRTKGKKTEAFCTHCGQTFTTTEKMYHNVGHPQRYDYEIKHLHMCPNCHAILATKAWGKHKELQTRDYVVLMQRAGEYVAFRKFEVIKDFHKYEKWWSGEYIRETLRVLADRNTFESVESYEQRNVPTLDRYMWADVKESAYLPSERTPRKIGNGIPYLGNMEEVLQGTGVRPIVAEMFVKRSNAYIQGLMIEAASKKYIEYLLKAGLTRLAHQAASGYTHAIKEPEAKNLKDLLGLDGQQLYELKQINGEKYAVWSLRYVKEHGEKLDRETLRFISYSHISPAWLPLQDTGMKLQRMVHYLAKQAQRDGVSFSTMMQTYNDYLRLARERGMDLKDDIVRHTPRIRELHDRYVEEKNLLEAEKAKKTINAKFTKIAEKFAENCEHFAYERSGLVIVVPACASDIKLEGKMQHHCVGASDKYMSRMNDGKSFILFLRKKEDPQKPYYTLEVEYDGNVLQSYGAYDRKPDWEQVEPVLKGFTRQIAKRAQKEAALSAAG